MTKFRFVTQHAEALSLANFSAEWFISFVLELGASLGARACSALAFDANYVSQPGPFFDVVRATPGGVYICYLEPALTNRFQWCGCDGHGAIFLPPTIEVQEVELVLSMDPGRMDAAPISTYVEWGAVIPVSRDWITIFSTRWGVAFSLFENKESLESFQSHNHSIYFLNKREAFEFLCQEDSGAPNLFDSFLEILPE